mgnify:CR=1 FL=1
MAELERQKITTTKIALAKCGVKSELNFGTPPPPNVFHIRFLFVS